MAPTGSITSSSPQEGTTTAAPSGLEQHRAYPSSEEEVLCGFHELPWEDLAPTLVGLLTSSDMAACRAVSRGLRAAVMRRRDTLYLKWAEHAPTDIISPVFFTNAVTRAAVRSLEACCSPPPSSSPSPPPSSSSASSSSSAPPPFCLSSILKLSISPISLFSAALPPSLHLHRYHYRAIKDDDGDDDDDGGAGGPSWSSSMAGLRQLLLRQPEPLGYHHLETLVLPKDAGRWWVCPLATAMEDESCLVSLSGLVCAGPVPVDSEDTIRLLVALGGERRRGVLNNLSLVLSAGDRPGDDQHINDENTIPAAAAASASAPPSGGSDDDDEAKWARQQEEVMLAYQQAALSRALATLTKALAARGGPGQQQVNPGCKPLRTFSLNLTCISARLDPGHYLSALLRLPCMAELRYLGLLSQNAAPRGCHPRRIHEAIATYARLGPKPELHALITCVYFVPARVMGYHHHQPGGADDDDDADDEEEERQQQPPLLPPGSGNTFLPLAEAWEKGHMPSLEVCDGPVQCILSSTDWPEGRAARAALLRAIRGPAAFGAKLNRLCLINTTPNLTTDLFAALADSHGCPAVKKLQIGGDHRRVIADLALALASKDMLPKLEQLIVMDVRRMMTERLQEMRAVVEGAPRRGGRPLVYAGSTGVTYIWVAASAAAAAAAAAAASRVSSRRVAAAAGSASTTTSSSTT